MKKILCVLGIIVLIIVIALGGIAYKIYREGWLKTSSDGSEVCDIFEYENYVYYVLSQNDGKEDYDVICRMKDDGTDKEVIVDRFNGDVHIKHNMWVYENYMYYSTTRENIRKINLKTLEETEYPFSEIYYLDDEFLIYGTADGIGAVKTSNIDNWDFEDNTLKLSDNRYNVIYADKDLILYVIDKKLYVTNAIDLSTTKNSDFLVVGDYEGFLLKEDKDMFFYVAVGGEVYIYDFNKETKKLNFVIKDSFEDQGIELKDQVVANIAVKDDIILYTIGSYGGSGGFWYGSTVKINKDGTGKEILVKYNASDKVQKINNRLYYQVSSQESGNVSWYVYNVETASSGFTVGFTYEEENYKLGKDGDSVSLSKFKLGNNVYEKVLTIPKRNKDFDFWTGTVEEVGDWLYIKLYEKDYNVGNWRGIDYCEFYRVSKDYTTIQTLDDDYIIKEPYSKMLSYNNVRLERGINATVKLTFVPYNNSIKFNEGTLEGKYVIETICRDNGNSDKVEIENVLFNNPKYNLLFEDYDFDQNPDFVFDYIGINGKSQSVRYEILKDASLKSINSSDIVVLSENDEIVKKLYGYISETDLMFPAHEIIENTNKLLSDKDKIIIAYHNLWSESGIESKEKYYVGDDWANDDWYEGAPFREETPSGKRNYLLRIPEKYVLGEVKKMFGNETNINIRELAANEIANADDWTKQFYAESGSGYRIDSCVMYDDGYFYRSASNEASSAGYDVFYYGKYGEITEDYWYDQFDNQYTNYCKAEQIGEDIVIYDSYIFLSAKDGLASKTTTDVENHLIDITADEYDWMRRNGEWPEQLKQKMGHYRHMFKKDSTGNYYWYASAMIN